MILTSPYPMPIFFYKDGNQSAQNVEHFGSQHSAAVYGKKRNYSEDEKDGMLNLYLGQIL